ncbi:hypothetical protein ACE4Z5_27060, partial [Salmonella enterica]|uniref:hypothetical protein n=1 Tax=Salmonella enterica TaxID=28901 RepID=UPI003D2C60DC
AGSAWKVEAHALDVGHLFEVSRDHHPIVDGGVMDGRVDFRASTDALRFHVDVGAKGARVAALAENADDQPQLGEATDVSMRFDGT